MVKNLPASAGDTGSTPDLGRPHMAGSTQACAPQLLSRCPGGGKSQELSPQAAAAAAPALRGQAAQQGKPPQLEKARQQQQRPSTAKNKYIKQNDLFLYLSFSVR